jgi:hypothetical protein
MKSFHLAGRPSGMQVPDRLRVRRRNKASMYVFNLFQSRKNCYVFPFLNPVFETEKDGKLFTVFHPCFVKGPGSNQSIAGQRYICPVREQEVPLLKDE